MFSFVLLDESVAPSRIIAARDPIGITTLYQGWSSSDPSRVYFSSELKAIADECDKIISFPPGHFYDSTTGETTRYYDPSWWNGDEEDSEGATNAPDLTLLRETLEAAVRKRLMSEVPYGVLLSGGLDSSLIAAIAARETEKVALAQLELRKKRLAVTSGTTSPTGQGDVTEQGEANLLMHCVCIQHHFFQQRWRLGHNCIPSASASRTLQTCSPLAKLLHISAQFTMSTLSLYKRVWMLSRRSSTTSRPTM